MKKKIFALSAEQTVLVNDLGGHAAKRAHGAITDTCNLVEDPATQYAICLFVIGSMICNAADMMAGAPTHVAAIEATLQNVTEVMRVQHAKCGDNG